MQCTLGGLTAHLTAVPLSASPAACITGGLASFELTPSLLSLLPCRRSFLPSRRSLAPPLTTIQMDGMRQVLHAWLGCCANHVVPVVTWI